MNRWKSRGGKSQQKEDKRRERQKTEDAGARKGRKVVKYSVFDDLWLRRLKSRLAKKAGAEPSGEMRDERLHFAWCEAHVEVKIKKHFSFGAFLKVEILKKCTPLWREAHFQVERVKNWRSRTILEVPPWWHKHISKSKVLRLTVSDHFSMSRCGKCALQLQLQLQLQLHYSYSYHYSSTTLQYTTLQLQLQRQMQLQPQLQLSQLQLHYTTSITLQLQLQLQLQLHYTTLQYSTLQVQLQLHYINWSTLTTPHHTTLQYSTVQYSTLHHKIIGPDNPTCYQLL